MAAELNPEPIHPASTGAVTPDLSPIVMGIPADNSSTHAVHPEEAITFSNPAVDNSSTNSVIPPGAVTFANTGFPSPSPSIDEPAAPEVETKVIRATPKAAPKRSKPAETK